MPDLSRSLSGAFMLLLASCAPSCRSDGRGGSPSRDAAPALDALRASAPEAGLKCTDPVGRCPEVVYALGNVESYALEVDGDTLYWAEQGGGARIHSAPKDGRGPVTKIGTWGGGLAPYRMFVVDGERIYWANDEPDLLSVKSIRKDGSDPREIEVAKIEWLPNLLGDGNLLWVVQFGCARVARIDKATGEVSITKVHDKDPYRFGGGTCTAQDEKFIYCGNVSVFFRFEKQSQKADQLAVGFNAVGPMERIGDEIYAVNNLPGLGSRQENLAVLGLPDFSMKDLGKTMGPVASMHYDLTRNTLYWTASFENIMSYSLSSGRIERLAISGANHIYYNAQDETYFYWSSQDFNPKTRKNAIMRIRKDPR